MTIKKINIHDIINCNLFYTCHLQWDSTEQTDTPDVRFCKDCKSAVTFVHTEEAMSMASEKGLCVAYVIYKGDLLEKILNYNEYGGDNPFTAPPITMGIPKRMTE